MEIRPKQLKIVHKPPYLPCIYFQVPLNDDINDFKQLEDKELDGYVLTLKKPKNKSLNANAYMWVLCDKIAKKLNIAKEDVYRKAVREVGEFMDIMIEAGKENEFEKAWSKNGLGWFCETMMVRREHTVYRCYSGSSEYDAEQLRRLVDYVVEEAKELKIPVETPLEIERLINLWQQKAT